MAIRTVVHFEIPASDVERLSEFYRAVFGWEIQKVEMPGVEYWLISTGPRGQSVGGGIYRRQGDDDRPRNFIGVDDLDARIVAFTSAGGREVVRKTEVPGRGSSYVGADPEGNLIAMFEPTGMPPTPPARTRARRPARRTARPRPTRSAKRRSGARRRR